ncbi:hypothetical protein [Streptomyces sp. NPDC090029]|uniref:hypothetical protein n=1 Tax=Streptomyces sp. NPDC090029 TaxID=3365924 RepID=UPI003829E5DA
MRTQQIFELCGHSFCSNKAPAGPGSRCADHLGDPVPDASHPDYWLNRAARAAASIDHGRGGLTERQTLAVHAADAGMPLAKIGRETGVYP